MGSTLLSFAATILAGVVFGATVQTDPAPARSPATTATSVSGQARTVSKTYGVYFPRAPVPRTDGVGIGLVRLVVSCGHVAAIANIPDDWYVQTLRPAGQSGREWSDFQFAWSAVEFRAGHGVARLSTLHVLDGAIRVAVDDATCFDMTAVIEDDMGTDWATRVPRSRLRLRD
jgi:hypothetical protein